MVVWRIGTGSACIGDPQCGTQGNGFSRTGDGVRELQDFRRGVVLLSCGWVGYPAETE